MDSGRVDKPLKSETVPPGAMPGSLEVEARVQIPFGLFGLVSRSDGEALAEPVGEQGIDNGESCGGFNEVAAVEQCSSGVCGGSP